ncbi:hypothetical protein [Erwinia sorbitola]|uniref:Uncharacterized protein n=1 Tax=Erwinia sorbitola TaxID=2681984 RepID=A0ABW9RIV9_9GAMM|nr:hypothetical protein [Erwinia sorbitola]MTD29326.1 hypothetical protein [Erwinia sorbitola]
MFIKKAGILILSTIIFSGSAFASSSFGGINSQEQKMRSLVTQCNDSIKKSLHSPVLLDISFGALGGVQKHCGSIADKTRKLITDRHNQHEKWEAEFQELLERFNAIPVSQQHKLHAAQLVKKIRVLTAVDKLAGRSTTSRIFVYRAMMKELDQLDSLLLSIDK